MRLTITQVQHFAELVDEACMAFRAVGLSAVREEWDASGEIAYISMIGSKDYCVGPGHTLTKNIRVKLIFTEPRHVTETTRDRIGWYFRHHAETGLAQT